MRNDSDKNNINITLLDKEFLINCPLENQPELIAAAKELDRRMKAIKTGGRVFGLERIAVMAALNLSHDLLDLKKQPAAPLGESLEPLIEKIQQALIETDHQQKTPNIK